MGGWVRDRLLGLESKDVDIEVYNLDPASLKRLLGRFGSVNTVGESFTVYKLVFRDDEGRREIDVSIPRRESKTGRGHRGFTVAGDPSMSVGEAARRRDFTINAMMFDPLRDQLIDPYGGAADLQSRRLRHVDATTFIEDSLRVLRAAQFAARFHLEIDPTTVALCRRVPLNDLPAERIWGEVEKLLLRAEAPSIGLRALEQLDVLARLFPELHALIGCPQDPEWHPEGDVWTHTQLVCDEARLLLADVGYAQAVTLMLAALCHDLGKPATTHLVHGRYRCSAHDRQGLAPTERLLDRLRIHTIHGYDVRRQVLALVAAHLAPRQFFSDAVHVSAGAFRRLARRVDCRLLALLAKADGQGRTGAARRADAADWFWQRIVELGLEHGAPVPLLQGRHLREMGLPEGPEIGRIIRCVYESQLDGGVTDLDGALRLARELIGQGP